VITITRYYTTMTPKQEHDACEALACIIVAHIKAERKRKAQAKREGKSEDNEPQNRQPGRVFKELTPSEAAARIKEEESRAGKRPRRNDRDEFGNEIIEVYYKPAEG